MLADRKFLPNSTPSTDPPSTVSQRVFDLYQLDVIYHRRKNMHGSSYRNQCITPSPL